MNSKTSVFVGASVLVAAMGFGTFLPRTSAGKAAVRATMGGRMALPLQHTHLGRFHHTGVSTPP
jgi:hypothetical protein